MKVVVSSHIKPHISFGDRGFKKASENKKEQQSFVVNPFLTSAEAQKVYFDAFQNIKNKEKIIEINAAKPVEKPRDLSNTKEFAKYLEYKIAKDLNYQTREDIEKLIEKIRAKTNADKKTVEEVLIKLTQFSSYATLKQLSNEFAKNKIDISKQAYVRDLVSLGDVFDYLGVSKGQIEYAPELGNPKTLFLDGNALEKLEELAQDSPEKLASFHKAYRSNNFKFVAIDGWNILDDDRYVSYSMFGQEKSLEDLAVLVIEKMRKEDKSLFEAMNGDFIKRFEKIFFGKIKMNIVQNTNIGEDNIDTILSQINPIMPNRAQIYSIIEKTAKTRIVSDYITKKLEPEEKEEKINIARARIAQYLDEMLACYSAQKLNESFIQKHKQLEELLPSIGKTMDDVKFLVPTHCKSFVLMMYQYMKVNNINPDNVIFQNESKHDLNDKVIVILDDFSGTGQSFVEESFDYDVFLKENADKNINVIFSPISSCYDGQRYVQECIKYNKREGKDFFLTEKVFDFMEKKIHNTKDNKEVLEYHQILDGFGYYGNAACVCLPYSFPDNNSGLGLLLSQYFLPYKKGENKTPVLNIATSKVLYNQELSTLIRLINIDAQKYQD